MRDNWGRVIERRLVKSEREECVKGKGTTAVCYAVCVAALVRLKVSSPSGPRYYQGCNVNVAQDANLFHVLWKRALAYACFKVMLLRAKGAEHSLCTV